MKPLGYWARNPKVIQAAGLLVSHNHHSRVLTVGSGVGSGVGSAQYNSQPQKWYRRSGAPLLLWSFRRRKLHNNSAGGNRGAVVLLLPRQVQFLFPCIVRQCMHPSKGPLPPRVAEHRTANLHLACIATSHNGLVTHTGQTYISHICGGHICGVYCQSLRRLSPTHLHCTF